MEYSEIHEYLSGIAPFNALGQELLAEVATQSEVITFPAGCAILVQDGPPSDHLQVIRKGQVKVYLRSQTGEEIVIDHRGEGECFGLVSLLGGTRSRSYVVDPAHGDFRLRPGSPAVQIGFGPWDLAAIGPRPQPAASKRD